MRQRGTRLTLLKHLNRVLLVSGLVQVTGMVATLLLGIQLARLLGPEQYGVYGVVLAAVSLILVPASAGLPFLALREAARATTSNSVVDVGAVLKWFVVRAAATSAITIVCVGIILIADPLGWSEDRADLVLLGAGVAFLISISGTVISFLRGVGANLLGQSLEFLVRPALASVGVYAISLAAGGVLTVRGALLAQLLTGFSVTALAFSAALRSLPKEKGTRESYRPQAWQSTALAFMLNSLLITLNGNYPIIVAGFLMSAEDTGILRVALSIWAVVGFPAALANIAALPIVARLSADGDASALSQTMSIITVATTSLTLLGVLALMLAGSPLIAFLFGEAYVPAYTPLMILSGGSFLISCFGITGSYLNVTGRERVVVKAFAWSVPTGLLSAIPLAQLYGINGIAFSTVLMAAAWHFYVLVIRRGELNSPVSILAAYRHLKSGGVSLGY